MLCSFMPCPGSIYISFCPGRLGPFSVTDTLLCACFFFSLASFSLTPMRDTLQEDPTGPSFGSRVSPESIPSTFFRCFWLFPSIGRSSPHRPSPRSFLWFRLGTRSGRRLAVHGIILHGLSRLRPSFISVSRLSRAGSLKSHVIRCSFLADLRP